MERRFYMVFVAGVVLAVLTALTLPASAQLAPVSVTCPDGVVRSGQVPVGTPTAALVGLLCPPPPSQPPASDPRSETGQPNQGGEPDGQPGAPGGSGSPADPAAPEQPPAGQPGEEQPGSGSNRPAQPRRPGAGGRRARDRRQAEGRRRQARRRQARGEPPLRNRDGSPAPQNPTGVDALPGPSIGTGVPNFIIRKFRVPIFLLPIYQAAGIQYGIRWEILAAINEIETDYGRNLNVSSAGALGWMQFMPATWRAYGVDANKDGRRDPYNPVDAIFAAANYLKASGAERDIRRAIFAYNHANWYVDSVMMRARLIAGIPGDLVGSLTGLTEGRFPVFARARYADDISEREAERRVRRGENAARVVADDDSRRGIEIYANRKSPVIAVNDGEIKRIGYSRELGRYIVLEDVFGNQYTYAGLDSVSRLYPVPKEDAAAARNSKTEAEAVPARPPRPDQPASAGTQLDPPPAGSGSTGASPQAPSTQPRPRPATKERLFAHPNRPNSRRAGGLEQMLDGRPQDPRFTTFEAYFSQPYGLNAKDVRLTRLREGSRVIGGTILGRVGKFDSSKAAHLYFEIRPAGEGAPKIDPKPILDGWKLLESTAIYRASGRNVLYGDDGTGFSVGQILLMPKPLLERRVLSDERIEIYECGRRDIRSGQINRRVLAVIAYLAEVGLRPSISSLKCGHSYYVAGGGMVSWHSSGNAVDIWKVNGIPILGHQERGGITEQTIRRLLTLQGTLRPGQIISLLNLGGPTFAMGNHADHIHVGYRPQLGDDPRRGRQAEAVLKPGQWIDLLRRLRQIENPTVPTRPSRYSLPADRKGRGSRSHVGE